MGRYDRDDDWDDLDLRQRRFAEGRPQSGLGIASIALAIAATLIGGGGAMLAGMIEAMQPMADQDLEDLLMGLAVLAMMFGGMLGFAGLALGFAGVMQSDRNPALAIVGAVLSLLLLVALVVVVCAGILSEM
jgi:hypothetical protein